MKVLLIHQYFKTPQEGGGIRSYYLALGLLASGFQVEVITGHNKSTYETKLVEGLLVHYLPVYYDNHLKIFGRLYAFIKFIFLAIARARRISRIDLVYAISTPLSVGAIALALKKWHNLPYIFEVGDLWPKVPIQMGIIGNKMLGRWLYRFERMIYLQAQKLVALSPPIKQSIAATVSGKEVSVISNMADCRFFQMAPKKEALIKYFQVEDKFVITYFGAAGKANHLEFLLEKAEACQKFLPSVLFLVLAYGSELSRIKRLAREKDLQNLRFLNYRDKEGLKQVLNVTDAAYISYADCPILQTGSPNRYFDALASGKLVILNFGGWLRKLSEEHQCGFYSNPHEPGNFIAQLKPFLENPELLSQYQSNARYLADSRFSRELQVEKLLQFIGHQPEKPMEVENAYSRSA